MYTAIQIANYFIKKSLDERSPVTPMKLQKLVFFAHGWYLGIKNEPLLDEQIEAWQFGPVVSSLYHRVKIYGNNAIKAPINDLDLSTFEIVYPSINDGDIETKKFLDSIWNVCKKYSGVQLSNLTHVVGSPWYEVVNAPENKPLKKNTDIPEEKIKSYYREKIAKADPVAI